MNITPLTPPRALPSISPLDTLQRFYQVLEQPAPLAGMSFPVGDPWEALASAGFSCVVCLTDDRPPYDPSPLRVLCSARFCDLFGERQPALPAHEEALLDKVVGDVVAVLQDGVGVVVHCAGGTGRTGTVIACVLRRLGLPLGDVRSYMKAVNCGRSKRPGWPESSWQEQQLSRFAPIEG